MPDSANELRNLIDDILNQKISLIHSRLDTVINTVVAQVEEAKDPKELSTYQIPDDLVQRLSTPPAPPPDDKVVQVHRFIKNISTSANQLNLINALLEGINQFCSRAALFLLKEDKLVGWKGRGFSGQGDGISDEEIKKIFFSLSANTVFKFVLEKRTTFLGGPTSQPDDHLIYSRFGGAKPDRIYVLPFFVKGKPQAIVYADSLEGKPIGQKEIEMISIVGEMSLDLLPLRQKILARVKTQEFVEEEEPPQAKSQPAIDNSQSSSGIQTPTGVHAPPEVEPQPKVTTTTQFPAPAPEVNEQTVPSIKENDPERLARVIINDIVLYNRTMVEDGLANKNLFHVLQDTILQARELYLNKFSDLSAFERQLVDNLARGDKESLKGYRFETL